MACYKDLFTHTHVSATVICKINVKQNHLKLIFVLYSNVIFPLYFKYPRNFCACQSTKCNSHGIEMAAFLNVGGYIGTEMSTWLLYRHHDVNGH